MIGVRRISAAASLLAIASVCLLPATALAADPVLVGAGDIAYCASTGDSATARLLTSISGTVFTTGDNAYQQGSSAQYANCYGPTWGQVRSRTRPTPGNHDYLTSGASGYFGYFGTRAGTKGKGYYAYNVGSWRIYALNSNCAYVSCSSTSAQAAWLKADLAANPRRCVLAYWHHALFSSGPHGNNTVVKPLWNILYAAHADVVVNGHDHDYERFARQSPSGARTTKGIREFVVGTGGRSHYAWSTIKPNSLARNNTTYGVLKLTLHSTSYSWKFVPIAGKTYTDSGTTSCG
jgi:acid phosphatase type 7